MKQKRFFYLFRPRVLLFILLLCSFFATVSVHIRWADTFAKEDDDYIIRNYCIQNKKITVPLKIALITDFHDRDVSDIAKKVKIYQPDIILLAGDIFERVEETLAAPITHPFVKKWRDFIAMSDESYDIQNSRELVTQLGAIAPVYISRGNHELYYLPKDILAIVGTDAMLLDNNDTAITVKGMNIRIGGLSSESDLNWLERFSKQGGMKILMSHHPEYYTNFIKGREEDTFDLVVSGHAHGGQWRFFDRGVYAPGQGLLPHATRGVHGKHIISTGVSNSIFLRRINNAKEIVFINAVPDSKH